MRQKINTILISFITTLIVVVTVLNMPAGLFDISRFFDNKLGATVTEITTATKLTDFPAIHNTNVNNLNDNKIEISTTTLPLITNLSNLVTVGTITTGVWTGTTLTVANGGTGSTTLSSNQLFLGNGTGILKTVVGFGTSGQFLTSNGDANAPTWTTSAIALGDNYAWTGTHNFLGTTLIKNFNASSTSANPIVLNGISLNTPSTQGASSTSLKNDGSGNLTWNLDDWRELVSTTTETVMEHATTTIPSGVENLKMFIHIPNSTVFALLGLQFNSDSGNNYGSRREDLNTGNIANNSNDFLMRINSDSSTTTEAFIDINISAYSDKRKMLNWTIGTSNTGANVSGFRQGAGVWNNTSDFITTIVIYAVSSGAFELPSGTVIKIYGK